MENTHVFGDLNFSSKLYALYGKDWATLEIEGVSNLLNLKLSEEDVWNSKNPKTPDFGVFLARSFSAISDALPISLPEEIKLDFADNCLAPALDIHIKSFVLAIGKESNIRKNSQLVNAALLLFNKSSEVSERNSGSNSLATKVKELNQNINKWVENLAISIFVRFQNNANDYVANKLVYQDGIVSPFLTFSLNSIVQPLNDVKENLDDLLRITIFEPKLGQRVDDNLYNTLVRLLPWTKPGVVEQFIIDLEALEAVFGKSDLRKLRSTRIFLKQEASEMKYEIPESDVQHLFAVIKILKENAIQ